MTHLATAPVAPLAAHQVLVLLAQVLVLLATALVLGRFAKKWALPALAAELCAGVLLGPTVLGKAAPAVSMWLLPADASQVHLLDALGQLGVLLLAGLTGLSLDPGLLRRRRATAVCVSSFGLALPLIGGIAIGFALPAALLVHGGNRIVLVAFLGVAMCVSAIPVIAKTLLDMKMLHRDIGQLIVGTAAIDDVMGWLLLSIVSAMATTGIGVGDIGKAVGYLVLFLSLAFLVGRPVVALVLRWASRSTESFAPMAAVVLLLVAFAAGTQALGLEPLLGALVGGMLIGSSKWFDRSSLAPLRGFVLGVLAPLFFVTAGLRIDLTSLARPAVLWSALAVLAVAVTGKFTGAYLGARLRRLDHWHGLALGAGLNSRGVVEVTIAMVGLRLGVLTTEMYTIIVLVALATSLMAPPVLRYAVRRISVTSTEIERAETLSVVGA